MSTDIHMNEMAIDLLKRLHNSWDRLACNKLAESVAIRSITDDCVELSRNGCYRNILSGLLANHDKPPTVEQVLMDHFKTFPSDMIVLDPKNDLSTSFSTYLITVVGNEASYSNGNKNRKRLNRTNQMKKMMAHPSFQLIKEQFHHLQSHIIGSKFIIALFLEELNDNDRADAITFLELQRRFECIDRHLHSNPGARFSFQLAYSWQDHLPDESKKLHFSRSDLLMEADAAWVSKFSELFSSKHVDELAGLCVVNRTDQEEQEDPVTKPYAEGNVLKDKKGKIVGSVFEIRNPLSPYAYAWLRKITQNEKYFEDAGRQQGRLRRIGSLFTSTHDEEEADTFVVFGNPSNAYGYLTTPASAADLFIMQIGQYIRKKHSDFIGNYIKEKHGSTTLKTVFPEPLPPIDTIIAQAANQGNNSADLGRHSDLKPGLYTNGNGPGGPFDLTTPTLSIQNHDIECTSVKWMMPVDGPDAGFLLRRGMTCGRSQLSYQGFGVQMLTEHETTTDSSRISGTGADLVRQVYSCRSIAPYFNGIFNQLEEGGKEDGIEVDGNSEMYVRTLESLNTLSLPKNGNDRISHRNTGKKAMEEGNNEEIPPKGKKRKRSIHPKINAPSSSGRSSKPPKLFDSFCIDLERIDLKLLWKWNITKRDAIYVLPGLKLVALAETCFQWCASSAVHSRMVKNKTLLGKMSIPLGDNQKKTKNRRKDSESTVPPQRVIRDFFEWDYTQNCPLKLGTECVTSVIAQKYGIKGNASNWHTWPVEIDLLNGILLREPEKNQLSIHSDPRSFSSDLSLILKGEKRKGAWLGGSGGGMNTTGQQPPTGVGNHFLGIFEKAQEVSDSKNLAIIRQCGKRTLINMFITEHMHPCAVSGEPPIRKKPSKEKCYYLGVYELGNVSIAADTQEELDQVLKEYKKNPAINGYLLRFREKPHIRIHCKPVDMPEIQDISEWTILEVAIDDPRRLLYVLPEANVTQMLDLTKDADVVRLGAVYDKLVAEEAVIQGLRKPVHQHSKNGEDNTLLLTSQTKRVYDLTHFIDILLKMSAAVFLRLLKVNVDRDGRIGPLVPPNGVEDNTLPEYIRLFGCHPQFAEFLGLEIQRSPSPHPMRSYDTNRLWLIMEFGSGIQRDQRKGPGFLDTEREEAKRMLISSFLAETIGNPCILQDWSQRLHSGNSSAINDEANLKESKESEENKDKHILIQNQEEGESKKTCKIPGNREEVASFIQFIDVALEKKGQESFSVLLNGFYNLPKLFRSSITFKNTLRHWTDTGASDLLDYAIEIEKECRNGRCQDIEKRERIKKKMIEILSYTGSLTKSNATLEFLVWHVMADMDELILGYPFGKPESVSTSFGSQLGMKRLRRSGKNQDIMKAGEKILALWMERSTDELSIMGLQRNETTKRLHVKINNREISVLDVEHWLCKLYWFSERDTGGSRSFSMKPSVYEAHLHPCMDIVWGDEVYKISNEAAKAMKRMIEKDLS